MPHRLGVRVSRSLALFAIAASLMFAAVSVLAQAGGKGSAEKKPATSASVPATSGDAVKGRGIYTRSCAICHFSKNTEAKIGPGLKSIYKRGKFADGKKVDDATMRAWIETGGKNMPQFKGTLSAQEISDLIAFIRTL